MKNVGLATRYQLSLIRIVVFNETKANEKERGNISLRKHFALWFPKILQCETITSF